MADVIARAYVRAQDQQPTAQERVIRLVEFGACADAALALLELELPQWKLRRLIYEDGEWHCSLSKHVDLPVEVDDMADLDNLHIALPPHGVSVMYA